jgi:hypothetical protein
MCGPRRPVAPVTSTVFISDTAPRPRVSQSKVMVGASAGMSSSIGPSARRHSS